MSLLINSQKVRERLEDAQRFFNLPLSAENVEHIEPTMPTAEIYGTLSIIPREFEKSRERLLALRQHLVGKGQKLLSDEELDKEIDDTRGR
jgi:hypothetical protein